MDLTDLQIKIDVDSQEAQARVVALDKELNKLAGSLAKLSSGSRHTLPLTGITYQDLKGLSVLENLSESKFNKVFTTANSNMRNFAKGMKELSVNVVDNTSKMRINLASYKTTGERMAAIRTTIQKLDHDYKLHALTLKELEGASSKTRMAVGKLTKMEIEDNEVVKKKQKTMAKYSEAYDAQKVAVTKAMNANRAYVNELEYEGKQLNELASSEKLFKKQQLQNEKDLNKAVKLTNQAFNLRLGAMRDMSIAFRQIGTALTRYVTTAFLGMTVAAVKFTAEMEMQQKAFDILLGSAKDGARIYGEVVRYAAETPYQLPELTQATKELLAYGSSASEVMDELRRLGDIAQNDADKLDSVTQAFGKVQARGVAHMRELNRFIMAGVPIISELQAVMNLQPTAFIEAVRAGAVSFDAVKQAIERLTNEGGKFFKMSKEMSILVAGRWSTLKDEFNLMLRSFVDDLMPRLLEMINFVLNFVKGVQNLTKEQRTHIRTVLLWVAAIGPLLLGISKMITLISALVKAIRAMQILKSVNSMLSVLAGTGAAVTAGFAGLPVIIGAVLAGLLAIGGAVAYKKISGDVKGIVEANKELEDSLSRITKLESVQSVFDALVSVYGQKRGDYTIFTMDDIANFFASGEKDWQDDAANFVKMNYLAAGDATDAWKNYSDGVTKIFSDIFRGITKGNVYDIMVKSGVLSSEDLVTLVKANRIVSDNTISSNSDKKYNAAMVMKGIYGKYAQAVIDAVIREGENSLLYDYVKESANAEVIAGFLAAFEAADKELNGLLSTVKTPESLLEFFAKKLVGTTDVSGFQASSFRKQFESLLLSYESDTQEAITESGNRLIKYMQDFKLFNRMYEAFYSGDSNALATIGETLSQKDKISFDELMPYFTPENKGDLIATFDLFKDTLTREAKQLLAELNVEALSEKIGFMLSGKVMSPEIIQSSAKALMSGIEEQIKNFVAGNNPKTKEEVLLLIQEYKDTNKIVMNAYYDALRDYDEATVAIEYSKIFDKLTVEADGYRLVGDEALIASYKMQNFNDAQINTLLGLQHNIDSAKALKDMLTSPEVNSQKVLDMFSYFTPSDDTDLLLFGAGRNIPKMSADEKQAVINYFEQLYGLDTQKRSAEQSTKIYGDMLAKLNLMAGTEGLKSLQESGLVAYLTKLDTDLTYQLNNIGKTANEILIGTLENMLATGSYAKETVEIIEGVVNKLKALDAEFKSPFTEGYANELASLKESSILYGKVGDALLIATYRLQGYKEEEIQALVAANKLNNGIEALTYMMESPSADAKKILDIFNIGSISGADMELGDIVIPELTEDKKTAVRNYFAALYAMDDQERFKEMTSANFKAMSDMLKDNYGKDALKELETEGLAKYLVTLNQDLDKQIARLGKTQNEILAGYLETMKNGQTAETILLIDSIIVKLKEIDAYGKDTISDYDKKLKSLQDTASLYGLVGEQAMIAQYKIDGFTDAEARALASVDSMIEAMATLVELQKESSHTDASKLLSVLNMTDADVIRNFPNVEDFADMRLDAVRGYFIGLFALDEQQRQAKETTYLHQHVVARLKEIYGDAYEFFSIEGQTTYLKELAEELTTDLQKVGKSSEDLMRESLTALVASGTTVQSVKDLATEVLGILDDIKMKNAEIQMAENYKAELKTLQDSIALYGLTGDALIEATYALAGYRDTELATLTATQSLANGLQKLRELADTPSLDAQGIIDIMSINPTQFEAETGQPVAKLFADRAKAVRGYFMEFFALDEQERLAQEVTSLHRRMLDALEGIYTDADLATMTDSGIFEYVQNLNKQFLNDINNFGKTSEEITLGILKNMLTINGLSDATVQLISDTIKNLNTLMDLSAEETPYEIKMKDFAETFKVFGLVGEELYRMQFALSGFEDAELDTVVATQLFADSLEKLLELANKPLLDAQGIIDIMNISPAKFMAETGQNLGQLHAKQEKAISNYFLAFFALDDQQRAAQETLAIHKDLLAQLKDEYGIAKLGEFMSAGILDFANNANIDMLSQLATYGKSINEILLNTMHNMMELTGLTEDAKNALILAIGNVESLMQAESETKFQDKLKVLQDEISLYGLLGDALLRAQFAQEGFNESQIDSLVSATNAIDLLNTMKTLIENPSTDAKSLLQVLTTMPNFNETGVSPEQYAQGRESSIANYFLGLWAMDDQEREAQKLTDLHKSVIARVVDLYGPDFLAKMENEGISTWLKGLTEDLSFELQNFGKTNEQIQMNILESILQSATATDAMKKDALFVIGIMKEFEFIKNKPKSTKELLDETFKDIGQSLLSTTFSTLISELEEVGKAFVTADWAGRKFGDTIKNIALAIMDALPQLLLQAGLSAITAGNLPVGLGLIGAAGVAGFVKGAVNATMEEGVSAPVPSSNISFSARGNAFENSNILTVPTLFKTSKGFNIGGEHGTEAILPLSRNSRGQLGVSSSGSGEVAVNIPINIEVVNQTGTQFTAETQTTTGANGERNVKLLIKRVVAEQIGKGEFDGAMRSRYGTRYQGAV